MSEKYDSYLNEHISAVKKCYELLTNKELSTHDNSKIFSKEYDAYDHYFNPDTRPEGMTDEQAENEFNFAWLHHQNSNPHHWQYWLLMNDDNDGKVIALEMPLCSVQEMIADWGAFSLIRENGNEIIKWYDANKDKMILHPETRKIVESLVPVMARKINEYIGK